MTTAAERRKLAAEWEALISRHAKPLERGAVAKGVKAPRLNQQKPVHAIIKGPASRVTPGGSTALAPKKIYTGTKIIGIATMHKSNMIPIFNEEAAVEVAQMRRN